MNQLQRPAPIAFNSRTYYASGTNPKYFYADVRVGGRRTKRALHRDVWEAHHGTPVPAGYQVHHVDRNPFNNDPANLSIKLTGKHLSDHLRERWQDPVYAEKARQNLAGAAQKATAWHKSSASHETHVAAGKQSWEGRQPVDASCLNCGGAYKTFFPGKSRFCHVNCHHQYKDRTKAYFESRTCGHCGVSYETRRASKAKTCSMSCAAKLREANRQKR